MADFQCQEHWKRRQITEIPQSIKKLGLRKWMVVSEFLPKRSVGFVKYGRFLFSCAFLSGGWTWKKYGISRNVPDLATLVLSIAMHATLYHLCTQLNILHPIISLTSVKYKWWRKVCQRHLPCRALYALWLKLTPTFAVCCLSCSGWRSDNFVVGLTNVSPLVSKPILRNYTLCGQYPSEVPPGATVVLQCRYNLPPFRYVVVQFPSTDYANFCEIQVMVRGMPVDACRAEHYTVQALSIKLQLFDLLRVGCERAK